MHPERWRLIDELFHAAVDLSSNERNDFLERACNGDVSLRAEIMKLIHGYDRAGNFIEAPQDLQQRNRLAADYARKPSQTKKTIETCEVVLRKL